MDFTDFNSLHYINTIHYRPWQVNFFDFFENFFHKKTAKTVWFSRDPPNELPVPAILNHVGTGNVIENAFRRDADLPP